MVASQYSEWLRWLVWIRTSDDIRMWAETWWVIRRCTWPLHGPSEVWSLELCYWVMLETLAWGLTISLEFNWYVSVYVYSIVMYICSYGYIHTIRHYYEFVYSLYSHSCELTTNDHHFLEQTARSIAIPTSFHRYNWDWGVAFTSSRPADRFWLGRTSATKTVSSPWEAWRSKAGDAEWRVWRFWRFPSAKPIYNYLPTKTWLRLTSCLTP